MEIRSRLSAKITNLKTNESRDVHCLNEIVIDRGSNPNVIKLDCFVENKFLGSFEGDGVLISSPTGSTAY